MGEVIKYHIFISVVAIELSVRCLNTGPEDRLPFDVRTVTSTALWLRPRAIHQCLSFRISSVASERDISRGPALFARIKTIFRDQKGTLEFGHSQ